MIPIGAEPGCDRNHEKGGRDSPSRRPRRFQPARPERLLEDAIAILEPLLIDAHQAGERKAPLRDRVFPRSHLRTMRELAQHLQRLPVGRRTAAQQRSDVIEQRLVVRTGRQQLLLDDSFDVLEPFVFARYAPSHFLR